MCGATGLTANRLIASNCGPLDKPRSAFESFREDEQQRRDFDGHQTNLSALQGQARSDSWILGAHENARRTRGDCRTTRERPAAPRSLTHSTRTNKAAPVARSEQPTHAARFRFGRARKLKASTEFADVARRGTIRAAKSWLSIMASLSSDGSNDAGTARFGVTVGRQNARRAVDRALVKRIVREACRYQAAAFEQQAILAAARIDVVLRLKAPLAGDDGRPLAMRRWRRYLRQEADELLEGVLKELMKHTARAQR